MYEIGIRVDGAQTFKTFYADIRGNCRYGALASPTRRYSISRMLNPDGRAGYETLRDEFASYGCELTYLGTCYPNKKILVQWQLNPQTSGL